MSETITSLQLREHKFFPTLKRLINDFLFLAVHDRNSTDFYRMNKNLRAALNALVNVETQQLQLVKGNNVLEPLYVLSLNEARELKAAIDDVDKDNRISEGHVKKIVDLFEAFEKQQEQESELTRVA